MRLRIKTVLFTGIVLLVLFSVLLIMARTYLFQNYEEYEKGRLESHLQRVLSFLKDDLDDLAAQATDYSAWDDTVTYVKEGNFSDQHPYIFRNYLTDTFLQNQLDFIVILNGEGKVAFAKSYDFKIGELVPMEKNMLETILSHQEALRSLQFPNDYVKGLDMVNGKPFLVAYRPIVDSLFQGPVEGTLVFGRFLDERKIKELSELLKLHVTFSPISAKKEILSETKQINLDLVPELKRIPAYMEADGEEYIYGNVILEDLWAKPSTVLTVKMERGIYQQGKTTIWSFLSMVLLLGSIFAVLGWFLVDKTVIRRLLHLKERMDYVQHTQDLLTRVAITGKDEISSLEQGFNEMIEKVAIAHDEILKLAMQDPLTLLPNRLMFREYLNESIERAKETGERVAVVFIDLDRFKYINDTLGHESGDELLVQVANRLQKLINGGDHFVSRLGGDEFTIVIPGLSNEAKALPLLNELRELLAESYQVGDHLLTVTASIGASFYPSDGLNGLELVKHADIAMYQAKEAGKNNVQMFAASMKQQYKRKMELEKELRNAIEEGQFALVYQPKLQLQSEKIIGMEALVRWDHPEKGRISPAEFIPLAEETGLIVPLGKWVLNQACWQNKQWQEQGFAPLVVSVNVSGIQFTQSDLVDTVREVLQETGMDASLLELEITETVLMKEIEKMSKIMEEIRSLGVNISIDDFGTGFCSLLYLKKLPVNTLKMDKAFIDDIENEQDIRVIESSIITLAKGLNLEVLAEGVETWQQYNALKKIGCDYIQGYLFSKPLPPDEFFQLFRHSRYESE
ncbi:bifunctional diguanylate cyclase/phosphodiesterase [Brevibacillus migulae]|uniref:bifunctional diguanylate cyclase/phosphodiesterase n=1 Tax=Brevibacillus migulae TaxID=1644114 RepID=UPI00106DE5D7|nr:EAL domain-containing protein [Brevibacillus migulae]